MSRSSFIIAHTAGDINYDVKASFTKPTSLVPRLGQSSFDLSECTSRRDRPMRSRGIQTCGSGVAGCCLHVQALGAADLKA